MTEPSMTMLLMLSPAACVLSRCGYRAAGISAKDFRENRWQGRNSQFLATTGFEV